MKRSKKQTRLLAMGCVLAASCGAALFVTHYEGKQEEIRSTDAVILELPSDSVTALSWTNETESLSFHRGEGIWTYDDDGAFPVDADKMEELLDYFSALQASFEISEVKDFAQYGLDEPVCTVGLTVAGETGETTYQMEVGDYSTMDSERYVSIGDGSVYLVPDDPMELFDAGIREMIDNDEDLAYTQVYELRFTGDEAYTVSYEADSPDALNPEDVYFTVRDGVRVPLDTERVSSYLEALVTLNPMNYVTYKATDAELADCGLDQPELTVAVDYEFAETENADPVAGTFEVSVGRNPDEVRAAEEAKEKDPERQDIPEAPAYIRIGDSSILYQISDSQYEQLTAASFDDLRHSEVFAANFGAVSGLDITLDGETYTLTNVPPAEENAGWHYGDEKIELAPFKAALEKLTASEFTDETPTQQEEISLVFALNHEKYPRIEVQLFRYDGESCLAVVNGAPFALVDRGDVVDLIETVHAIVLNGPSLP